MLVDGMIATNKFLFTNLLHKENKAVTNDECQSNWPKKAGP